MLLDSVRLFRNHFIVIAIIILPIIIPVELFDVLFSNYVVDEPPQVWQIFPPLIVGIITYPIYTAGVIFYVASVIAGEAIDVTTAWRLALKYWRPFILLAVLVGVSVIFGLLFFIIPGIILAVRFAFAEFELLLNDKHPLDAMRISWDTTKLYMWTLLGGFLIITIILYTPYVILASAFEKQGGELGVIENILNIVYSVLSLIYTIFAFRVFHKAMEQDNQKPDIQES